MPLSTLPRVLSDAQRLQRWQRLGYDYKGFAQHLTECTGTPVVRTSVMRAVTGFTRKPARLVAEEVAKALGLPIEQVFRSWK